MAPPYQDWNWIYALFAGHGTGYFQVLPFLELLITGGVPLYLLAAFVEQTVNGQSNICFCALEGPQAFDEEHFYWSA